jgi:phenylalanine-4-hydroxylase
MAASVAPIPEYLAPYVVTQDPALYTPMDHAGWRYILKISRAYFARHAHQKYLDGLRETGISTERIPLISEMSACLSKFGWQAVAVSGFIPPAVFMEFQSLGILPIACDMRQTEHLAYTPAPDIVHEAAGHAPLIADREYAAYLRAYGELSRKAIFSNQDMDVYHAIRSLSIIKEDPASTPAQIEEAQRQLDTANAGVTYLSEATLLSRMGWWTFEYGLVGDLKAPQIFGAGLLSSVGESYHCLSDEVRKVPFSLRCIDQGYDITKPQPQLFVAPDFSTLTRALDELAQTMSYKRGGMEGLRKAKQAATVTTTVLDSGVQVTGLLEEIVTDQKGEAAYLRYLGACQLAHADQELSKQGVDQHRDGFGTAVGRVKGLGKSCADLDEFDFQKLGFVVSFKDPKPGRIELESGVVIEGVLKNKIRREGRNLVLTFESCTVKLGERVLFDPSWGVYDLACGERVVSVFGGAADRRRYLAATGGFHQPPTHPKTNLTPENRALNALYGEVRAIREAGAAPQKTAELSRIQSTLDAEHPDEWLLRYELLELSQSARLRAPWEPAVRKRLEAIAAQSAEKREIIGRGLEVLT